MIPHHPLPTPPLNPYVPQQAQHFHPAAYFPLLPEGYPNLHQPAAYARPTPLSVSWEEVWDQLMAAKLGFRASLWSDNKCVLLLRRTQQEGRQFGLTGRERIVFERTLQGDRQKQIAADLRIATSTVANCLKSSMLKLGFESRLEAAPLAALRLSHARQTTINPEPVLALGQGEFIVASAPAPQWKRFNRITTSERAICSFIIQGKSNTEIATARETSIHTVENQVASLFRKLRASGRFDLLNVLYP